MSRSPIAATAAPTCRWSCRPIGHSRGSAIGVYTPTESSAFIRGIALASLRDNVALEGSVGWFAGDGRDLVGRFADSDFAYVRLKYYF